MMAQYRVLWGDGTVSDLPSLRQAVECNTWGPRLDTEQ